VRWRTGKILTEYAFPERFKKKRRHRDPQTPRSLSPEDDLQVSEERSSYLMKESRPPRKKLLTGDSSDRALTQREMDVLMKALWRTRGQKLLHVIDILNHDLDQDILQLVTDQETIEIKADQVSDSALLTLWNVVMEDHDD
jgi:hypothetical protein